MIQTIVNNNPNGNTACDSYKVTLNPQRISTRVARCLREGMPLKYRLRCKLQWMNSVFYGE